MSGLTVANGANIVAEWQAQGWAIVVNNGTMMPNGQVANKIPALDINVRRRYAVPFRTASIRWSCPRGDKFTRFTISSGRRPKAIS